MMRHRGGASKNAGLRAIQDPDHVKVHKAGLADLEARAEVVQAREPWENAMEIMRERKCGWVHSRIVSGKMVILLAQKFRVQAGVVEVLVHGASEAEKDEAEAEGVWVAAPVEGDLKERDTGWLVQLVEGGSAGGGKDVPVVCGLWKQHRPIIMGSMGESLLSIEPAALAGAHGRYPERMACSRPKLCTTAYTVDHVLHVYILAPFQNRSHMLYFVEHAPVDPVRMTYSNGYQNARTGVGSAILVFIRPCDPLWVHRGVFHKIQNSMGLLHVF